jgi:serine phosphatase RsbU (regulator of sigma subunit)
VDRGRAPSRSRPVLWTIVAIGLTLTVAGTWATARADDSTEDRLLQVQTQQAAAVLSTAILGVQQPLTEVLEADQVVPPSAQPRVFATLMSPNVGKDQLFTSASLWRGTRAGPLRESGAVGKPSGLASGSSEMQAFLHDAMGSDTFAVRRVDAGGHPRIAYAFADPQAGAVVYAERAIPRDGRATVDRDSAFSELNYAIYLGPTATAGSLTTTNVDPATLPLGGETSTARVKFGDAGLTLVTSARNHLGSPLGQWLPWMVLVAGLLLTLVAWLVARTLVRARQRAEADTSTITDLYERVDSLYAEQRALALGLQHALLPSANPDVDGLEVAAEYVAGAVGVDIGGDWFSVIEVGERHFGFVVGDVSGRGVDAVAEMAHARFTLRAYLLDGDPAEVALEKCSRLFDVAKNGHIVTVLVGVGDRFTGQTTLASAGHLPPLLVAATAAEPSAELVSEFVTVPVGPPLGAGASVYSSASLSIPEGATLVAYTDGLVERRGEDLAVGMGRLANAVRMSATKPLQALVSDVLASMRDDQAADDIAVLALRRSGS